MLSGKQRLARILYLSAVCMVAIVLLYSTSKSWSGFPSSLTPDWALSDDKPLPHLIEEHVAERLALVVASQTTDNTTWLEEVFPTWEKVVYLTDAPSDLSVPANKGRESMVYLTYVAVQMSGKVVPLLSHNKATSSTTTMICPQR
jgi:hypothetical protein